MPQLVSAQSRVLLRRQKHLAPPPCCWQAPIPCFLQVPDALKSTLPIGELAGVVLLAFFGINSLKVSRMPSMAGNNRLRESVESGCNAMVWDGMQGGAIWPIAKVVFEACVYVYRPPHDTQFWGCGKVCESKQTRNMRAIMVRKGGCLSWRKCAGLPIILIERDAGVLWNCENNSLGGKQDRENDFWGRERDICETSSGEYAGCRNIGGCRIKKIAGGGDAG
eukprot:1144434-Pelagomonas_calceolata.AAC.9